MLILIFQIIFALSAIGFLVIIFRKIPIILRYPRQPFEEVSLVDKVKEKINSSNFFHEVIIHRLEKFLRKIKIIVLKIDNFLAKKVDRLRDKIRKKKEEEENGNMPS